MIVRDDLTTLTLITQPDHAALASRAMWGWTHDGLPAHPRRASLFRAFADHDRGWADLDASPSVHPATGLVGDFMTLPIDRRQSVWPRSIDAAGDDPWAAALIAHHAWYVYGRFRADPAWTPFFADMTRRRDDQIARAGGRLDLDTLERDYALVRLADLISLVFCNRWTDPHGDFGYDIRGDGGAAVIVSPDPFAGADVPLEVPARVLARRPFRDDADLRVEWARAERVTLRGTLTGRG